MQQHPSAVSAHSQPQQQQEQQRPASHSAQPVVAQRNIVKALRPMPPTPSMTRWPEIRSDGHPYGPKVGPHNPRCAQHGSSSTDEPTMTRTYAQYGTRMVPDWPTLGPEAPNMGPRWTEDGSKMPVEGSFGIYLRILAPSERQLDPSGTQNGSIWPRNAELSLFCW
jgi:hypothetical protein